MKYKPVGMPSAVRVDIEIAVLYNGRSGACRVLRPVRY